MPAVKVLVVDDNCIAAEAMQKLLTLRGYDVSTSHCGEHAIQITKEFDPRAIMLDIGLPDMNGYEVARKLKLEEHYTGTLVALTGYGQDDDKNSAENAGFDFHLTKPASLKDIEAILSLLT